MYNNFLPENYKNDTNNYVYYPYGNHKITPIKYLDYSEKWLWYRKSKNLNPSIKFNFKSILINF